MLTHETKKLFPMDTCTTQIKIIKTLFFYENNCARKKLYKKIWRKQKQNIKKNSQIFLIDQAFIRLHMTQINFFPKDTSTTEINIWKTYDIAYYSYTKKYTNSNRLSIKNVLAFA